MKWVQCATSKHSIGEVPTCLPFTNEDRMGQICQPFLSSNANHTNATPTFWKLIWSKIKHSCKYRAL